MAITYPLSLPSAGGIRRVRMAPLSFVAVARSPFTGQQQAQQHQGRLWQAEIEIIPMRRAAAEKWIAFLLKLGGRFGTFLMGDPAAATPRGAAKDTPGTPLVAGAGQTGQTLAFDGAPAGVTGYLLAGDYIQLGSGAAAHLHKVLADADSDGGGNVSVGIWPPLRSSPADDDPVTVADAKGLWRLASNESAWDVSEALIYGLSFAAVEAI